MPTPYATETKTPTSSPGTSRARATAGAIAGKEKSAMVASVCAASVAINGQRGMILRYCPIKDGCARDGYIRSRDGSSLGAANGHDKEGALRKECCESRSCRTPIFCSGRMAHRAQQQNRQGRARVEHLVTFQRKH